LGLVERLELTGIRKGRYDMEAAMTAIETTGTVDEDHRLRLDEALPVSGPMRVRVIVLYPLTEGISEDEWLRAAARNPAFRDLEAPEEDVYSLDVVGEESRRHAALERIQPLLDHPSVHLGGPRPSRDELHER
jgi:hypothetical protein